MGKKMIAVALLCTAVLVTCIGSVGAYMRKETQVEENEFLASVVSCVVDEEFTSNQKTSIKVQNTGNIDAYLRVRLVSYWIDGNGHITYGSVDDFSVDYDTNNWIKQDDIYYYIKPVKKNEKTPELLKSNIVLKQEGENRQVVQIFAEAIQSVPEKAVENSWHVTVENKIITAVTSVELSLGD